MPRVALTSAKLVYAIATENSGQAYIEPAYLFSGTFNVVTKNVLRRPWPAPNGYLLTPPMTTSVFTRCSMATTASHNDSSLR